MSTSLVALLGFAAWTILLVFALASYRAIYSQRRKKALNEFRADGSDVDPLGQRLTRAHLNCVENLPVAGAVILAAAVAGRSDVTDGLALPLLGARIAQSSVHLLSTAAPLVLVRGLLFATQLGILVFWIYRLLA